MELVNIALPSVSVELVRDDLEVILREDTENGSILHFNNGSKAFLKNDGSPDTRLISRKLSGWKNKKPLPRHKVWLDLVLNSFNCKRAGFRVYLRIHDGKDNYLVLIPIGVFFSMIEMKNMIPGLNNNLKNDYKDLISRSFAEFRRDAKRGDPNSLYISDRYKYFLKNGFEIINKNGNGKYQLIKYKTTPNVFGGGKNVYEKDNQ